MSLIHSPKNRLGLLGLLAGAILVTPACGGNDAAAPAAAQARIHDTVPRLVDDSVGALEFLGDSETWNGFAASMDSMNVAFSAMPFEFPFADETVTYGKRVIYADPIGEETEGEAFARFLAEKVFTEANYEGDGVYRLHGADFCPADELTGVPDPECVADFDAAEIRIRAETAGDGLDLTLLIGPGRAEPLVLELRSASVALMADLAEAKEAIQHLASVAGEAIELPSVMEGRVSISLTVNGPKDVTLAGQVRQDVRIEAATADGPFAFSTAAKDPLWSIRAQGIERRLSLDLDLGVTTASFPAMTDTGVLMGQMAIDWKGLSASVVLEDGATSLVVNDIGIGDGQSTVKLGDETLLAFDLNADAGRRYALSIDPVAGELPTFSFEPKLDLSVYVHLAPLAAFEFVESYLMDETYRIVFDGATPTAQPVEASWDGAFPGGLRIVSGTLSVSSSAAAAPVVANAGQCLIGADEVTAGEHPLLGYLAAVSCP